MKQAKQIRSIFLALALIGSLCACSKNNNSENNLSLDNLSKSTLPEVTGVKASLPEMLTPDVQDDLNYVVAEVIDTSGATAIQCSGTSASVSGSGAAASSGSVKITAAGNYVLSGDFTGQIRVAANSSDKVVLILDGFNGENSADSVIYVESADKVTIKMQDATSNTISDTDTSIESDSDTRGKAAIYSKASLEFSGSGTLEVSGAYKHAIATTKKLTVSNGTVNVVTVASGLKGNNSVVITGGAVYISSVGDGIKTKEEEDTSKGFVDISGGKITVSTESDAIHATISCEISGGTLNIVTTGSDTANASNDKRGGMFGSHGGMTDGDYPDEKMHGGRDFGGEMSDDEAWDRFNNRGGMKDGDYSGGKMHGGRGFDDEMSDGEVQGGDMDQNQAGTGSTADSSSDADVSSKGIKVGCDAIGTAAELKITGGTITISSTGHSVHSTGNITVSGTAELNLTSHQKGISAHNEFQIDGGTINIDTCTEGVESKNDMHIDGGSIIIAYSTDDAINVGNSGKTLYISGGYVEITTSSGDTDGIDSNGDLVVGGGFVFVKGGNATGSMSGSIDVDGKVYVNGGTVIALGGICDTPQSSSDACTVTMNRKSFSAGSYTITSESGDVIAEFTLSEAYTSAWISSTDFVSGGSYTITKDGTAFASWTQSSKTQAAG